MSEHIEFAAQVRALLDGCLGLPFEATQERRRLFEEIGTLGEKAVPALVAELDSPMEDRAAAAAVGFGFVGSAAIGALPQLFKRYVEAYHDQEDDFQWEASVTIEKLGVDCTPYLSHVVRTGHQPEAWMAIYLLTTIRAADRNTFELLAECLLGDNEASSSIAAGAIASFPSFRDEAIALLEQAVQQQSAIGQPVDWSLAVTLADLCKKGELEGSRWRALLAISPAWKHCLQEAYEVVSTVERDGLLPRPWY
jgi:hypothetical protein